MHLLPLIETKRRKKKAKTLRDFKRETEKAYAKWHKLRNREKQAYRVYLEKRKNQVQCSKEEDE